MVKTYLLKFFFMIFVFTLIVLSMNYFDIDVNLDNLFKVKAIDSLTNSIKKVEFEIQDIKEQIISDENNLLSCQALQTDYYNQRISLVAGIEDLKMICGNTDVKGPGVTLRIADNLTDDNFSYNDKIVHDLDVRLIVNDLNNLGAEAVAINGKRIVNTTEIICSGPVISINGEVVAAPFFVKAIGDPDKLIEAVNLENSYAYTIKRDYGIDITAMKNYIISISGKKDNPDIQYSECIKCEENEDEEGE
ncbi:DUF881 domain-containing protein [Sedimentibacter sp. zth1]|uniref:DUF881 domain-containing protein n=1 Tax=Sedimentibacter sp. zth1 TaxID=2816908 RepID=UPI001A91E487|nr:DUF881 domain-containing protein [Sedimentibacter sp. zth1]QSX06155.1 DUF881 domain-containing protein [Sedimentibacter sp. zth1]